MFFTQTYNFTAGSLQEYILLWLFSTEDLNLMAGLENEQWWYSKVEFFATCFTVTPIFILLFISMALTMIEFAQVISFYSVVQILIENQTQFKIYYCYIMIMLVIKCTFDGKWKMNMGFLYSKPFSELYCEKFIWWTYHSLS